MEYTSIEQEGVEMIDGQTSIFEDEPIVIEQKVIKKEKLKPKAYKKEDLDLTNEEKEFIIKFINYYSANLIKWYVEEKNQETVHHFINNIKVKLGDDLFRRLGVEVKEVDSVKDIIKGFYK